MVHNLSLNYPNAHQHDFLESPVLLGVALDYEFTHRAGRAILDGTGLQEPSGVLAVVDGGEAPDRLIKLTNAQAFTAAAHRMPGHAAVHFTCDPSVLGPELTKANTAEIQQAKKVQRAANLFRAVLLFRGMESDFFKAFGELQNQDGQANPPRVNL